MSYDQPYLGNQGQQMKGYPQPQYGMQPQFGQPVNPPPQIIVINQGGSNPDFCRLCRRNTPSRIQYIAGTGTWLICVGLVLLGFWLGCCLIPFCVDSLQDRVYYCTICSALKYEKKLL